MRAEYAADRYLRMNLFANVDTVAGNGIIPPSAMDVEGVTMLVREALRLVGFEIVESQGECKISRGRAVVEPLYDEESFWSVAESVLWAGEMRYGLFLICHQDEAPAQVFDLANTLRLLPRADYRPVVLSAEQQALFGQEVVKKILSGGAFVVIDEHIVGFHPGIQIGVCLIRSTPVWFSASSLSDAVYQFRVGAVSRCYDLFVSGSVVLKSDKS